MEDIESIEEYTEWFWDEYGEDVCDDYQNFEVEAYGKYFDDGLFY